MAKSNYLFGVLLLTIVCVHFGIAGNIIGGENQVSRTRNQDTFPVTEHGNAFKQNEASRKRALVKQIYDSQIGMREAGINRGPEVEKYLRYVNLRKGNPWCAAFVCWVYGQGGVSNPRSGWSPLLFPANKTIWERAESGKLKRAHGSQLIAHSPQTGDVFGIYFPEKKRIAHVGFIDAWDETWLITVEGNTNISGDREGDGVYRKRRLVRSIYRVARYIN